MMRQDQNVSHAWYYYHLIFTPDFSYKRYTKKGMMSILPLGNKDEEGKEKQKGYLYATFMLL